MKSRELNILALSEPTKVSFQKRIDEIGAGLHKRYENLLAAKTNALDLAHIYHLFCIWESFAIDFEKGIDMNFGKWQDEMECLYWEIIEQLDELEETTKSKGGEKK